MVGWGLLVGIEIPRQARDDEWGGRKVKVHDQGGSVRTAFPAYFSRSLLAMAFRRLLKADKRTRLHSFAAWHARPSG